MNSEIAIDTEAVIPTAPPTATPTLPPCASWDIWRGAEIEGAAGIGVATLFIRSLKKFPKLKATDNLALFRDSSKCDRVWFCKEFKDWRMVKALSKHFAETCIEVTPECLFSIPLSLRQKARIYLKVILPSNSLKAGDHICVGAPFEDEAFELGTGRKVTPSMYNSDIKVA